MSECVPVFNSEDIEKACGAVEENWLDWLRGSRETLGEEIREGGDAESFSVVWTGRWRRSGGRAPGDAVSVFLRRDAAECVRLSVCACGSLYQRKQGLSASSVPTRCRHAPRLRETQGDSERCVMAGRAPTRFRTS